jgi:hypothetical protein
MTAGMEKWRISMSVFTRSRWIKRLGISTVALSGLGAVTMQSTPADARVFVGVGVPAYGYGYAPYPYSYYPAYYGYPYYGYPYGGGVYFGFGGGHYWHHH